MKAFICLLSIVFFAIISSCSTDSEAGEDQKKSESLEVQKEAKDGPASVEVISFDINMDELYGNWVLIGVGDDPMGPGIAPYGEILFAFTQSGEMAIATEGEQELAENLAGIPSPYEVNGKLLCSDDIVFKLQFKQECCEVIRLNEGRMSIGIDIGEGTMYKHFVRLE